MKKEILKLRAEGRTYSEIEKILGCSRSTISYHCNPNVKNSAITNQRNRRKILMQSLIEYKGGKCLNCGYYKCSGALEFHHRDPQEKDFSISDRTCNNLEGLKKEVDKCDLLCANCHRELHYKTP